MGSILPEANAESKNEARALRIPPKALVQHHAQAGRHRVIIAFMPRDRARTPLVKINPHFADITISIDPFDEASVQENISNVREIVEKYVMEIWGADFHLKRIDIAPPLIVGSIFCRVAFMEAPQFRRAYWHKIRGRLSFGVMLEVKKIWPSGLFPHYYVRVKTEIKGEHILTDQAPRL